MSSKSERVRYELAVLARRKRARDVEWTPGRPCDWRPNQVKNPSTGEVFTEEGAWQFIGALLEGGHPICEIVLKKPAGKTAYIMKVNCGDDAPELYIKLQLGSGKIIGRSFHYSESPHWSSNKDDGDDSNGKVG